MAEETPQEFVQVLSKRYKMGETTLFKYLQETAQE